MNYKIYLLLRKIITLIFILLLHTFLPYPLDLKLPPDYVLLQIGMPDA